MARVKDKLKTSLDVDRDLWNEVEDEVRRLERQGAQITRPKLIEALLRVWVWTMSKDYQPGRQPANTISGACETAVFLEHMYRAAHQSAQGNIGATTDTKPGIKAVQSGSHVPNNPELDHWLALTEKILTSADLRTRAALMTNISEFARLAQLSPVEPANDESITLPAPDDLAEAARRMFESAGDADERGEEDSRGTGTGS